MQTDTKTLAVANLATDKPQDAAPPVAPPKQADPPQVVAEDDDFDSIPDAPPREADKPAPTPEPEAQTTQPAAAAPPAPVKNPHPRGLVRRALELGLPAHVIDSASLDELDEWLYQAQNQARFNALQQQQHPSAPPAAPQEETLGIGEIEKDLNPGLKQFLLNEKKEKEALKQALAQTQQSIQQRDQQRAQQEMFNTWDRAFRNMPAKFKKLVGDGDGHALQATSEEMRARMDLIQVAGITPQDNHFTIEKKIHEAANRIYGRFLKDEAPPPPTTGYAAAAPSGAEQRQVAPSSAEPAPNGRISKETWAKAGLAKPTQREGSEPKGEKAMMQAVKKYMVEHPDKFGADEESEYSN